MIISDTTFERIRSYYVSDGEQRLDEGDEKIRIRWSACFAQLHDEQNCDKDVVKIMIRHFSISEGQAYKDIRNCRRLFGDVRLYTKDAVRYHVFQWSIELMKMARQKKDFKAMGKALERLTKAYNPDKEDIDLPDPSKVQPPMQLLTINYNFLFSPYFKMIDESGSSNMKSWLKNFQTGIFILRHPLLKTGTYLVRCISGISNGFFQRLSMIWNIMVIEKHGLG